MNSLTRTAVEVFGRRFELRAAESGEHLQELAGYVDRRMRELAEVSPHVDTAKLAVLTELNIADEHRLDLIRRDARHRPRRGNAQ